MSSFNIEDIMSLLSQKKGSFRIHLCPKDGGVVVLASSKPFYNHTHGANACCLAHPLITRASCSKVLKELEEVGVMTSGKMSCRKPRVDRGGKHKYPAKPKSKKASKAEKDMPSSDQNESSTAAKETESSLMLDEVMPMKDLFDVGSLFYPEDKIELYPSTSENLDITSEFVLTPPASCKELFGQTCYLY